MRCVILTGVQRGVRALTKRDNLVSVLRSRSVEELARSRSAEPTKSGTSCSLKKRTVVGGAAHDLGQFQPALSQIGDTYVTNRFTR